MNTMQNHMKVEFDSYSGNESFARVTVASFLCCLNPTVEELEDIKTAVSEAVTNSIIHGYGEQVGTVTVECTIDGDEVTVAVSDKGVGISDIEKAMEPLFTTRPDLERSGMGFAFMEAFMDTLEVTSAPFEGCHVKMKKKIGVPLHERYNCLD